MDDRDRMSMRVSAMVWTQGIARARVEVYCKVGVDEIED